eukprot:TRINITY_DN14438_c0_g2_i1.p1 TRINITY_DN14438_c0_g2~~TRINITY_DN14438_c0_g2_i1.p1  ORF type:complete len:429 (+),score=120.58 TRINITY_DN14438_c0_g2_i1:88-1287(+)
MGPPRAAAAFAASFAAAFAAVRIAGGAGAGAPPPRPPVSTPPPPQTPPPQAEPPPPLFRPPGAAPAGRGGGGGAACRWEGVSYAPSALEQRWAARIAEWQLDLRGKHGERGPLLCRRGRARCSWNAGCLEVMRDEGRMRALLAQVADRRSAPALPDKVPLLSVLRRRDGCGREQQTPIEPLVSFLRDPRDFCLEREVAVTFSTDWLALPWGGEVLPDAGGGGGAVLLDAGASVDWNGSSGRIANMFERQGIEFSRIVAWETQEAAAFMDTVPPRWKGRAEFRNRAATSEEGHADNPLAVAEAARAAGAGYVVFKLDIDSSGAEQALVQQLMRRPWLVDELFWEQHAMWSPMVRYWCGLRRVPGQRWKEQVCHVGNQTLADGYRIFAALRSKGVRAHAWI